MHVEVHRSCSYSQKSIHSAKHFVLLTKFQMNNFEGMACVVSVFGNAAIQRLKPLWNSLPSKVKNEFIVNSVVGCPAGCQAVSETSAPSFASEELQRVHVPLRHMQPSNDSLDCTKGG